MDYHYLRHICPTPARSGTPPDVVSTYPIVKELRSSPGGFGGFPRSPPEHSYYTHFFVAVKGSREDFQDFFVLRFLPKERLLSSPLARCQGLEF